jgi:hypothetical protein
MAQAFEFSRDYALEIPQALLGQHLRYLNAGPVQNQVHASVLLEHGLDDGGHTLAVGEVRADIFEPAGKRRQSAYSLIDFEYGSVVLLWLS